MLTFQQLCRPLAAVEVIIGGAAVPARVLSYADEQLLEELCPRPPITEYMADPSKGSNAPYVPNTGTAAYRSADAVRRARLAMFRVAAALDYQPQSGPPWSEARKEAGARGAWSAAVRAEFAEHVSERELYNALEALDKAAGTLVEEAAKN